MNTNGQVIKSYRDLIVWQKSYEIARSLYIVSKSFPKEELYGLTSQIRRAAVSVPSNIAEGYGRRRTLEYERFLSIAMGSLFELQTQLSLSIDLGFSECASLSDILESCNEVERMLSSLIKKISNK